MSKETEAIFSSTGNLGVSRRPFHRLYVNGTRLSADPEEFSQNFQRLASIGDRHPTQIGRSVFRGVATDTVVEHIAQNQISEYLEVSLPLEEFTGDSSSLIYMAKNSDQRTQIVPTEIMHAETEYGNEIRLTPQERVKDVLARGYTFSNTFSEDQIDQVHALWGETFGWSINEVKALRDRLNDPLDTSVWFSSIEDRGTILSLATAERLNLPATSGLLPLVESTEWRTRDDHAGEGLMSANLSMLNAQILARFKGERPLIYAECNFQSHADRAGHGAGFSIPLRDLAPQILVQNVNVQDHVDIEKGKLRDFTFMYLPMDVIQAHYDPVQRDAMIKEIRS